MKEKIVGMIPSRYGSKRFPGKPLAMIAGKTLIQHTYENALKCQSLDTLLVATDDQRIFDHVKEFGGAVVLTSECETGTDRLAEAISSNPKLSDAEIVINIQGDEPCINPSVIDAVATKLHEDPSSVMSTAVVVMNNKDEIENPSNVKCVFDIHGHALYFSRNIIPYDGKNIYKHLGIYGYRKEFILHYSQMEPTPLQLTEDLEQLKVLEHGYRIKVAVVDDDSIGVDTPEDIKKVEELL